MLERIAARRAELDGLEEQPAKQLAEVRARVIDQWIIASVLLVERSKSRTGRHEASMRRNAPLGHHVLPVARERRTASS